MKESIKKDMHNVNSAYYKYKFYTKQIPNLYKPHSAKSDTKLCFQKRKNRINYAFLFQKGLSIALGLLLATV